MQITHEADARIAAMHRTIPPKAAKSRSKSPASYAGVRRMIDKAAFKYSAMFQLPLDDMQAQARFLYCHAASKYESCKATKFSTFLHIVLEHGLLSYGRWHMRKDTPCRAEPYEAADGQEVDPLELVADEQAERQFLMAELYQSLTADERELVDLALLGFASTLHDLKQLAVFRLHFAEEQFDEAVAGIKELLREAA